MCKKSPTHGFRVSTKSRPKFAENQISNFHIPPKWWTIRPNPRQFLSDPQSGNVCQLSGVVPLRGQTAAILAKNVRRGGSSGQTGSRNMAASRFLDFSTPTSYSTPSTLGGLSRTVTELPLRGVTITPLLRPPATRKNSKSQMRFSQL